MMQPGLVAEVGFRLPVGLEGIVREFGDVRNFVTAEGGLDPRWEMESLAFATFPFALTLAWDHSKTVSGFRCHRRLTEVFGSVFAEMVRAGLKAKVHSFGRCFMYRPQRTGAKLSTHSWGIAIDLNPETNGLRTVGDMDARVVKVFREGGLSGAESGRGERGIRCTFSFVRGIRFQYRVLGTEKNLKTQRTRRSSVEGAENPGKIDGEKLLTAKGAKDSQRPRRNSKGKNCRFLAALGMTRAYWSRFSGAASWP